MPRAGENGCFQVVGAECSPVKIFPEIGRIFAGLPLTALTLDVLARKVGCGSAKTRAGRSTATSSRGPTCRLEATEALRLLVP